MLDVMLAEAAGLQSIHCEVKWSFCPTLLLTAFYFLFKKVEHFRWSIQLMASSWTVRPVMHCLADARLPVGPRITVCLLLRCSCVVVNQQQNHNDAAAGLPLGHLYWGRHPSHFMHLACCRNIQNWINILFRSMRERRKGGGG